MFFLHFPLSCQGWLWTWSNIKGNDFLPNLGGGFAINPGACDQDFNEGR